ncbi:PH domain-containing protein [Herbiconiux sp. CPCC 205763]|uniref:PH domain-containing protein n=1 Tax=Herbiconiux aconitum TaxID=2970913 RepID=A0ABT2GPH2_9MICO|nr:PH domain-containing protein [Herbiconiux aconitum]MCS5718083.1 PH domain-containing protein [Herbiconiux aconitum]
MSEPRVPGSPLEPAASDGPPKSTGPTAPTDLTDGEWHRLHPATPLLRGGIVLVAILGFVLANFRERLIDWIFGAPDLPGDPFQTAYERGQLGWAIVIVIGGLVVGIVVFYASWRMHTFRVGDDVVEVRSGILFRTHRRARLDRIQGVAISRPIFARLFGAAKLDISVAGQDAKVQLAYLRGSEADRLRRDVLVLASGAREAAAGPDAANVAVAPGSSAASVVPGVVNQRVRELLAPELDPSIAPPESVVKIPPLRLILSLVLSGFTVVLVLVAVLIVVMSLLGRREFFLFLILPGVLAAAGYYFNRFTKSLRFSIAGTADGVRIGFGLLSTSNDTLPPGRIHAIEVSQPLLWRPVKWWMIRINRAGAAGQSSSQTSTLMLPVGTVDDVSKVLGLLLPGLAGEQTRQLVLAGLLAKSGAGFTDAPRRAWPLRPFSWKRTGYAETDDAILLRSGFVWRHLTVVPLARVQSLRISQGPVQRVLDLVELTVHTVTGPVRATLGAADRAGGTAAFGRWSAQVVDAGANDHSTRWAEGQTS